MSHQKNLRKLIGLRQRHLQKLKEQQAAYGLASPAHILLEIEDTAAELAQLQAELAALPVNEDGSFTSPTPAATPRAAGGPVFNSGSLQAAIVNQGGTQTFGDLDFGNLDFSETTVQVEQGGAYVADDQMNFSDNFQGAILNIKSQLSNVSQTIRALPDVAQADKDELLRLVNELRELLEQAPPDKTPQAETVAKRTDKLVKELEEANPDREMAEMMGHSLKKAAENLAGALPAVLDISIRIVACVLRLAG